METHPDSLSAMRCQACGHEVRIHAGIPNFAEHLPLRDPNLRPIQRLNNSPIFAVFYETPLWRGFLTRLGSGLSMQQELELVLQNASMASPEAVADLATGTGHYARALVQRFPRALVYGVDISLGMLKRAQEMASRKGLQTARFLRGDIFQLPFGDGTLDAVVCCGALHLFAELGPVWEEVARVLRRGGVFCGWTLVRLPRWHERRFQQRLMRRGKATFFEPQAMARELGQHRLGNFRSLKRRVWLIFRAEKLEP